MKETLKSAGARVGIASGLGGALTMVGFMLAGAASAEEGDAPAVDPVLTEFTNLGTKIGLYGAAIVTLVVLSAAIFLGIKYLRKGVNHA